MDDACFKVKALGSFGIIVDLERKKNVRQDGVVFSLERPLEVLLFCCQHQRRRAIVLLVE